MYLYLRRSQLDGQVTELQGQLAAAEHQLASQANTHERQIAELNVKVTGLEAEKERALKDKDRLLDEVGPNMLRNLVFTGFMPGFL